MIETDRIQEMAEHEEHLVETREFRIFGPPGTGKTTNLSRQIGRAAARYGAHQVLVTSFSRAAAAELTARDLPIPGQMVGTLHSHCWHALGGPKIAEANVNEWNRDHPDLAITPVKRQGAKLEGEENVEDDPENTKQGDAALQRLSRYRGARKERKLWPRTVLEFDALWSEYKRENGLLDFTDLIEVALREVALAPHAPSVIFADEAQDLNALQLALIRKWGQRAEYFIVAGDDDQTIYSFTGATPDAFLDPEVPADHRIILKQSYRVPRAVHAFAERLIHTVSRRQVKEYVPRDEEGAVARSLDTCRRPEHIVADIARSLESGKDVMLLAACAYMLQPVIRALRSEGVPFHNPYRRSNGSWNPLHIGKPGSAASRIVALVGGHPASGQGYRPWTMDDVVQWAEWLAAKSVLRHSVKSKLKTMGTLEEATIEKLNAVFESGALDALADAWDGGCAALVEWWQKRLPFEVGQRVQFPVDIAKKRGPQALARKPQVIVGTIHSVKGGQADTVYVFPDLSQAGDLEYRSTGLPKDSVIRLFYVAATRARERLVICESVGDARIWL